MSNFPIIATVLSMVLGLSVTRLLLGVLTVFWIRRAAAPDWVARSSYRPRCCSQAEVRTSKMACAFTLVDCRPIHHASDYCVSLANGSVTTNSLPWP